MCRPLYHLCNLSLQTALSIFCESTWVRRNCIKANTVSQTPSVWANVLSEKLRLSPLRPISPSLFGQTTAQIRLTTFQPQLSSNHTAERNTSVYSFICSNSTNVVTHKCLHAQMHACVCAHTYIHTHKDTDGRCPRPLSNAWTHACSLPEYTNVHFLPRSHLGFISGTWETEIIEQEGGRAAGGFYIRYDPIDRIMYCYEEGKKANNAKGFKEQKRNCPHKPKNLLDFSTLTILTRCPGVAVMSQVHSLRLGYLSGQLGLLRVPLGLWILCSHSAGHTHMHIHTHTHTHARTQAHA